MYSDKIEKELKKKNIMVGDRVKISAHDSIHQGILMPRPDLGDQNIIVLKLDNGYNVGVRAESIELESKNQPTVTSTNEKEKAEKDQIAILGCGGTIASKIEYTTGAVYPSITPKELRLAFPELASYPIHSKQIFSLFSDDLNTHHWKLLADEIESEIKDGSKGVVVMHGTDTMTYSSAAISFMLQNLSVPVVFVGSQRSPDRPSSENKSNILNSVYSASQDLGEVVVCMHSSTNDDFCHLHRGTRVRKMHTSRRDAFKSINCQPLFAVDHRTKRFEELSSYRPRNKGELVSKKKMNDNVALIYVHPNIKPDFISALDNYDGVVLIGTGLGHVPTNAFNDKHVLGIYKPIKELIDSGIPVAMASQTIYGRVCLRVYTNGRLLSDAGVIGDGADWTPETAYIKLCWVLGQTKKMEKVREMMMTNLVGEISERSPLS